MAVTRAVETCLTTSRLVVLALSTSGSHSSLRSKVPSLHPVDWSKLIRLQAPPAGRPTGLHLVRCEQNGTALRCEPVRPSIIVSGNAATTPTREVARKPLKNYHINCVDDFDHAVSTFEYYCVDDLEALDTATKLCAAIASKFETVQDVSFACARAVRRASRLSIDLLDRCRRSSPRPLLA